MTEDNGTASVSFTTKEMLVRMDGKLDVLAAKQTHYDVELALLKARASELESTVKERARWGDEKIEGISASLETARVVMAREVEIIKHEQNSLAKKLAYATGTVSTLIILASLFARFIH